MLRLILALAFMVLVFTDGDRIVATLYALDATGVIPLWQVAVALGLAGMALAWLPLQKQDF